MTASKGPVVPGAYGGNDLSHLANSRQEVRPGHVFDQVYRGGSALLRELVTMENAKAEFEQRVEKSVKSKEKAQAEWDKASGFWGKVKALPDGAEVLWHSKYAKPLVVHYVKTIGKGVLKKLFLLGLDIMPIPGMDEQLKGIAGHLGIDLPKAGSLLFMEAATGTNNFEFNLGAWWDDISLTPEGVKKQQIDLMFLSIRATLKNGSAQGLSGFMSKGVFTPIGIAQGTGAIFDVLDLIAEQLFNSVAQGVKVMIYGLDENMEVTVQALSNEEEVRNYMSKIRQPILEEARDAQIQDPERQDETLADCSGLLVKEYKAIVDKHGKLSDKQVLLLDEARSKLGPDTNVGKHLMAIAGSWVEAAAKKQESRGTGELGSHAERFLSQQRGNAGRIGPG